MAMPGGGRRAIRKQAIGKMLGKELGGATAVPGRPVTPMTSRTQLPAPSSLAGLLGGPALVNVASGDRNVGRGPSQPIKGLGGRGGIANLTRPPRRMKPSRGGRTLY